ncbi:hypothetical protein JMJ35_005910 [Cladonia borealis]|uniref:Pentatricopeptide repeat domain-containing protein n=1 Tax=Cladonia borealis TaxID=184061 RepID=A0AA39QY21_9LECA|nr:hypothetical protein JMJ35_005910 [Cladonia borealis]
MRPALQRLLDNPASISVLRKVLYLNSCGLCQHYSHQTSNEKRGKTEDPNGNNHEVYVCSSIFRRETQEHNEGTRNWVTQSYSVNRESGSGPRSTEKRNGLLSEKRGSLRAEDLTENALESCEGSVDKDRRDDSPKAQDSTAQFQHGRDQGLMKRREWREYLSTFEQFQKESEFKTSAVDSPRLIDNGSYSEDWLLWLELIRFRRRHAGIQGIQAIYLEIFSREKHIPTTCDTGKELWDLLFQAGHQDPEFLKKVIDYATRLKRSTGNAAPRVYGSVVEHALKADPRSALEWHRLLKQEFAPSIEDYKKLLGLSASWGSIIHLRALYNDYPLFGLYATAIPELSRMQMYEEAIEWHSLLSDHKDLPLDFDDLKPLLAYFVQAGNSGRVEKMIDDLVQARSPVIDQATKYVRKNQTISRELMSRQLGEVHGVAPKQLSDSFCARLFATRLFVVKTVINGLQMMAVDSIGPLSLREIALRDECFPPAILRHLDDLKNAGILLDGSLFAYLLQKLAREDNNVLLKSLVESDLHPDALDDTNLQEKLLAQYYAAEDQLQVERTLAVLTARGSSQQDRARMWWNAVLRSHVTLRKLDVVKSILNTMQQAGISVTSRSSRHLRVHWLTRRQKGQRAERTQELSIIIRATKNTLESGGFVPISAWKEIMRRLGMAGRLVEFENLALWLADYYASPAGQQSLPPDAPLQSARYQEWINTRALFKNKNPSKYLNVLFTTDAQQAIVVWGFQQEVKMNPDPHRVLKSFRRLVLGYRVPYPPTWAWGLVLLKKLQERGVPIQQATVSRICRHRLTALFGPGNSSRPINRRTKWSNDMRARAIARYRPIFYVRKMEDIWGRDLFRHQIQETEDFRHRKFKRSRYWWDKVWHNYYGPYRKGLPRVIRRRLDRRKTRAAPIPGGRSRAYTIEK